jgi:phenylalanyl-tRNA synthetase beta chain
MEIGRLYRGDGGNYAEFPVVTLGATGIAQPRTFSRAGQPYDFFEFKADVSQLLSVFDIHQLNFEARDLPAYYAAGRSAQATADGALVAYLGELEPKVAARRKIRQSVFLAEIHLEHLYRAGLRRPSHRALARVPGISRDFSLLVPEGVSFEEIRTAIGSLPDVTGLEPAEIFRGAQVPQGCYSLLLRATWQRAAESLTDEEVNRQAEQIVQDLRKKLGVERRS